MLVKYTDDPQWGLIHFEVNDKQLGSIEFDDITDEWVVSWGGLADPHHLTFGTYDDAKRWIEEHIDQLWDD